MKITDTQFDGSRFTLTDSDRYEIACIRQEAPQLSFQQAQLLHEYRHKSYGITRLQPPELRFCEALEDQLALAKAEAAIPLRRANDDGSASARGTDRGREQQPPTDPAPPPELARIDLAKYDTAPIPEREWGVRDRFPRRAVCLLSGEGAVGKSITLLQLAVAHALGRDWLRSMPEQGPVLLVNCEDEGDELVRRLDPILKNYRAKFSDIAADLHVFSLANQDPLLALPDRSGRIVPTPLYAQLLERARAVQPICTVIDNVADVYGGSEIDRSQVRQFVALMRQIAIAANGYVIMSSHPSVAGIASKTGLSGSTQWHNSMRARAYMHIESDDRSGTRVLEFMKSNYSALSERVELQWANGLYVPVRAPSAPEQAARNAAADALFLQLLDRFTAKGENVSPKQNANNYAPTLFAKTTEGKAAKFTTGHFADALDRLIAAAKVAVEPYGAASRGTSRIVRRGWSP
ncbi:AAA family ATPase [Bradyrhizobium cytisi]|uniref:AAA family ATPase n=1 Tax=Bradyrhizobium cytisi TaxID=515489 RepID=A0A5S4WUS0_9BRAD|nr:AAA family ATPase [Bradyrhizobium cytisi]TYL85721.1 AAA family ATPase [Bradyrhizobium cytisi]